jgi:hypothetical protein
MTGGWVGTIDSYLISKVEIPQRKYQHFLLQYNGKIRLRNRFGRPGSFHQFDVVAVSGGDGNKQNLVWTTNGIEKYFEWMIKNKPSPNSE